MRRAAVLFLLVASVACSTTSTAAVVHSPSAAPSSSASPPASASPSQSPSEAASPSPSPSPGASPTPFVFTLPAPVSPPAAGPGGCVLPIYWLDGTGQNPTAGFLFYPSGTIDPSTQTLTHTGSATYDRAVGRWLPVGPEAISPDGLEFAYAEYDTPPLAGMESDSQPRAAGNLATAGRVHLMDASSGKDRILLSGTPTYSVVGFTAAGIYLAQIAITMDGDFSSGLYLLPLTGGAPAPVAGGARTMDRGGWTIVNGSAWGTDFTPGTGGIQSGNELVELDLHTGAVTNWLTSPEGTGVGLLGYDASGHPLVLTFASGYSSTGSPPPQPPTQVVVLASPQHATVIYQSTDQGAKLPFGPVFANGQGAWMGSQGSIWVDASNKVTITNVNKDTIVGVGGTCQ